MPDLWVAPSATAGDLLPRGSSGWPGVVAMIEHIEEGGAPAFVLRALIGRMQVHVSEPGVSIGSGLIFGGTDMVAGRTKPASWEAGWISQHVDITR